MENKNLLIAVALSVGFLFFWSSFIMPRFAPHHPPVGATAAIPGTGNTPQAKISQGASMVSAHPGDATAAAKEMIFRDQQNEITFSPRGGGVGHWRLMMKGQEVDLVNKPEVSPLPLANQPETNFTMDQHKEGVTMRTVLPNGLRLTKVLMFSATGYLHKLSYRFENPTSQPIELKDWQWGWGPGLGTAVSEKKDNSGLIRALSKGKLKTHALKPGDYSEFGDWAAIDNRYFLVAFLPITPGQRQLHVSGTKDQTTLLINQPVTVPAKGQVTVEYEIYVGPKGYTQLGKYHKGLEAAVDFGFFSWLGKIILRAIYWLQRHTGNYGWAIVILTIILQVLMFPLTVKSFKATMAMKKLQPQIAALQKTLKGDPKRLNIEMMNLYKKTGTNPFGGCLPMLLQLPIFWALFTTLRNAYELRGAPFVGWIHDLSAADPYHVLPIVMGGAMFLQQRMAGATTDPTQKQMMMMMPVMFTVMFFNFPAGLVLYWLTNNLVTMAFQYGMLRHSERKPTFELVK